MSSGACACPALVIVLPNLHFPTCQAWAGVEALCCAVGLQGMCAAAAAYGVPPAVQSHLSAVEARGLQTEAL